MFLNRLFGTQLVRKDIVEQLLPTGAIHGVKGRFNATSAGVRALLGHPTSHEARKFMGMNSVKVFVPIPGEADVSHMPRCPLLNVTDGASFERLQGSGSKRSEKTLCSGARCLLQ